MNKKTRNLLIVLVVLCLAAFIIGKLVLPAVSGGSKSITVNVTHGDESTKTFTYKTDAEYLSEVLLEKKLIEEDAAWVPMYSRTHLYVLGDRVESFIPHWAGYNDFAFVNVKMK